MELQSETENIHKLITETVPVFFFVYNIKSRKVEYISSQFLNYVTKKEEFQDLDPHEKLESIISEESLEKFHHFFADLSKENRYKSSVELRTSNISSLEWIEINTFKATKRTSKAKMVVGHIVDITTKKKQYEILNRENERLENFINMMAHDLKAPLANLSLVVDLLKQIMTTEELHKYEKYLDILKITTKDSGELITKLLHFATLKGEASKLDLDLHDLRYVVKEVVKTNERRISSKNLQIKYDFPEYAVEALLDITLFRQVLFNLLENAIKFTPRGGSIMFKSAYLDGHMSLSIEDSGIGIPERYLSNVFKNNAVIKRDGLDGEKSTGLGLYICLQIMKIHSGHITVDSIEHKGTTFTLHLPVPDSSATYF